MLKDLFEKLNLKFKRKNFDKRSDVSQEPTKEFSLPLVNAKDGNNGIMFYGREEDWDFAEMTIDIVNDGAVSTANVYPQPQKTGVLYNAYLIKPKFKSTVHLLNFFATSIYKTIKPKYAYEFKATWNRVSEEKIFLPTKNGEIDFDFMEKFITELEAERIAELEAYLSATGLKDFVLTEEEKFALENLNSRSWKKFLLKDLFEISTGSLISSQKLKFGDCPRISVKNFDNGIYGMFDTKNISEARHHKNFITVNFFGNAFYHPYEASIEMKVHALKLKNKEFTSATGLFITSVINYSLKNKFSYGDQLSSSDLKNLDIKIKLPTKDGEIDFEFMEKFISAVQKIIVADVVKYSEEKISAYRQAANK